MFSPLSPPQRKLPAEFVIKLSYNDIYGNIQANVLLSVCKNYFDLYLKIFILFYFLLPTECVMV